MALVGTCKQMCSEAELVRREKERRLHKYESKVGYRLKADRKRCVKEFTRAAAGQALPKASDVRPPEVLLETVNYLLSRIAILPDEHWLDKYDFMFDRLRSVRQDMIFQDVFDQNCVNAMECIVRFHIYSIYKSCEVTPESFDQFINDTHLRECLKRLIVCYNEQSNLSKNSCEFETYYILFHFGFNEVLHHSLLLPSSISTNILCHKAVNSTFSWYLGNFVRAFRIIKTLPFLCCVALMPHFENIRRDSLKMMNTGYSVKNGKYPIKKLVDILLFDDVKDAISTCKYYGLNADEEYVYFLKSSFLIERSLPRLRWHKFITDKHSAVSLTNLYFGG